MTLGAFPSAEFLYSDFIILHVHPELLVSTKMILESVVNFFVITAACQINFGFVVAFDAPAHCERRLRKLNQSGVLVYQLVNVLNLRYSAYRVSLYITVAILTLQTTDDDVLLVTKEYVVR